MSDRLLITGASGFVGRWVARAASRAGYPLRLLVRPTSDLTPLAGLDFERVDGDLLDPPSLERALVGVSGVIHAAGTISFARADAARVRAVNLDGTRHLFAAATRAGVPRLVHTASIFALGHTPREPRGPDGVYGAEHLLDIPYVQAKRELELASSAWLERGLRLIRLYPGICLGPGDRNLSSSALIRAWLDGRVPALVRGGICYVDVREAAAAHVAALESGEIGARYLLPGRNLTHQAFFARLAPLAGRPAPRITLPGGLATVGAALLERLTPDPALRPDVVRLMRHRWWFESRPPPGMVPAARSFEQTLVETLADLQAQKKSGS